MNLSDYVFGNIIKWLIVERFSMRSTWKQSHST